MEVNEINEVEIDIKQLFFSLLDRWFIIVLFGVLCAVIASVITHFFISPKYESSASIYIINQENENQLTNSDLSASTSITSDVEVLITSRTVLERVIETVGLNTTVEKLVDQISTNNPTNTRILKITVEDTDPNTAKLIADTVAQITAEQTVDLMDVVKVNIIEYGNVANSPSSPSLKKNVLLGGLAGVFVALFVLSTIFIFDDKIRTSEEAEKYLGASVLGSIPLNKQESEVKSKLKILNKKAA